MFQSAPNVDASHSVFNDVGRDQFNAINFRTSVDSVIGGTFLSGSNNITINATTAAGLQSADTLLNSLPRAKAAGWDHSSRSACLAGTRTEELKEILNWIDTEAERRMYLLTGLAGTGKTTIAQSVAELADGKSILGASFFCSRDSEEKNDIQLLFPTLAFQLSKFIPQLRAQVGKAIMEDTSIHDLVLDKQLEELIVKPLQNIPLHQEQIVIVVDALDECKGEKAPERVLQALARHIPALPFLKIFLTSRPVSSMNFALLDEELVQLSQVYILHNVRRSSVDPDISLFLNNRLAEIAKRRHGHNSESQWPPKGLVEKIVQKSAGLFIFASTVCKFIESTRDHKRHLDYIASIPTSAEEGRLGIDALYMQVIDTAIENFTDTAVAQCRFILGTVVLLFDPFSLKNLADLLGSAPDLIYDLLENLHSVLMVPSQNDGIIRTFHASFHDFLTSQYRCSDRMYVQPARQHGEITLCLFKWMKQNLRRNICELHPYQVNAEVDDLVARREKYIGEPLAYACRYWAEHLSHVSPNGNEVERIIQELYELIRTRLLYWIEVLSLLDHVPIVVRSLAKARSWLSRSPRSEPNLDKLLDDANKFIHQFSEPISVWALHTYYSALPSTPHSTLLSETFQHELRSTVKTISGQLMAWDSCLRVMEAHSDVVSVAFSPDGESIVSGSWDNTVRLWDSTTCTCIATLHGHLGCVRSTAFSPGGECVASCSDDSTIRIWDSTTGACITTLCGSPKPINSVAFSPDGNSIICGSDDKNLHLWSSTTHACIATLSGHTGLVTSVAFSPDSARIISGSYDSTLRLWNATTGACIVILQGHSEVVCSVAFSPDGTCIVSGSDDHVLRLWDSTNLKCIAVLQGHQCPVTSVAFSPGGERIVSGSYDSTLRLWNPTTGSCIATLKGHSDAICSVAFSPDGTCIVSASHDKTMRLWDSSTCTTLEENLFSVSAIDMSLALNMGRQEGYLDIIRSVSISPDSSCIVSRSNDGRLRLWNSSTGTCVSALEGHFGPLLSVAFSQDSTLIAVGFDNGTMCLWDTTTHTSIATFYGTSGPFRSVMFLRDSNILASESDTGNHILCLWDTNTLACTATLRDHSGPLCLVSFSLNGRLIVTGYSDNKLRLWDPTTGLCLATLEGHFGPLCTAAFSDDNTLLASGSADCMVCLWNVATREHIVTFKGHSGPLRSVVFSQDTALVASGSEDHTVGLWSSTTCALIAILRGHCDTVRSVAFSQDSTLIISGSDDCTVCIWSTVIPKHITTLRGHSGAVRLVVISEDGSVIASESEDFSVRVWSVATHECITTLKGYYQQITSVALLQETKRVISASGNTVAQMWNLTTGACVATVKSSSRIKSVWFTSVMKEAWILTDRDRHAFYHLNETTLAPIPISNSYLAANKSTTMRLGHTSNENWFVTGSRRMRFRLYSLSSGGDSRWGTTTIASSEKRFLLWDHGRLSILDFSHSQ